MADTKGGYREAGSREPTFLTSVVIDGAVWVSTDNHWGNATNVRQLLEEEAQANDRSQVLAALDFALSRLQPTSGIGEPIAG